MAHSWTPAQLNAIGLRGCDILVSAAAGSGKTAALTERIIRSLTRNDSPADITRILAVTFTRAAAAELRRRISSALSSKISADPGNRRLIRQLMLLGSAKICTIDSFYGDIVKSNFQRLSLPANFRIADSAELALLQKSLMEDLIDSSYKLGDQGFLHIAENFSTNKSDAELSSFLIDIYDKTRKFPEGVSALSRCAEIMRSEAEVEFFTTRSGELIASEISRELEYITRLYNYAIDDFALPRAYIDAFRDDREIVLALASKISEKNYSAARKIATALNFKRLGSVKGDDKTPEVEQIKSMRDSAKKQLGKIASSYFSQSEKSISDSFVATAELCDDICVFISRYDKILSEEKLRRGICDFEDIRRFTLSLLVDPDGNPTDIARAQSERFDEIFIDEYQDVDEIQDIIFRAISGRAKRFMVGDIKQSIYGFRGAEPALFSAYRAAFPIYDLSPDAPIPSFEEKEGRSVFMSNNFRCDESVINFTNEICRKIFTAGGRSINYLPEDDLIYTKPNPTKLSPAKVQVALIVPDETDDPQKLAEFDNDEDSEKDDGGSVGEVGFITSEISRLLDGEKKNDGSAITPGDIAVICRSKSTCRKVADSLRLAGIPAVNDGGSDYLSDPGVSLVISLLTVIDNPQKDIPLAAVMRSPIFNFTMDELTKIRRHIPKNASLYDAVEASAKGERDYSEKCAAFCERLNAYRALARSLPTDRLMRHLLRDTALLSLAEGDEGDSDIGRRRLLRLYEYARQFESGSFRGLYNFIKYLQGVIDSDNEIGNDNAEIGANAVTVITIHHSKGLEFPVCFVCGCGRRFELAKEAAKDFLPNREYGPAARLRDSTGLAKLSTPLHRAAVIDSTRRQVEEEMRLFYVALTRARERLYVTAAYRYKLENKLESLFFKKLCDPAWGALSARSYLDWLILTLNAVDGYENKDYIFKIIEDGSIAPPLPYFANKVTSRLPTLTEDELASLKETLTKRFSYSYPYEHLTRLPAKLSVSRLYPGVLDEEENAEILVSDNDAPKSDEIIKKLPTPSFMLDADATKADAAERGTATHVFMQFCDWERCRKHGIDEELGYLTEKKFISERIASLVNREELEKFFASPLFKRIISARWVKREQRFNVLLPAEKFSENRDFSDELQGEELLVQGVIDIFFEDTEGKLVLCDYKTDYLTPAELASPALAAKKLTERHSLQLSYYADALERICGRRPDDILIYSLPLGDFIEIKL